MPFFTTPWSTVLGNDWREGNKGDWRKRGREVKTGKKRGKKNVIVLILTVGVLKEKCLCKFTIVLWYMKIAVFQQKKKKEYFLSYIMNIGLKNIWWFLFRTLHEGFFKISAYLPVIFFKLLILMHSSVISHSILTTSFFFNKISQY